MKKLTIRLKITLWFTVFMLLLSAIVFLFILFVSDSAASSQAQGALVALVEDNMDEAEYDDGALDIDDDFIEFRSGVYCLLFDSSGMCRSGYSPYGDLTQLPFTDGVVRSVSLGKESVLIYDRLISDKEYPDLWVRGIAAAGDSPLTSSAVYQATLFSLPLLILLAAVGGYLLAKRSLRPIQDIRQTAQEIASSGDLSKRIALAGQGKDELHQLADTFNHMFARLETNFDAERNFTSDASHELRTPVATILAQCEYAFENASDEQELYACVASIQKQGFRISRLIEALLQLTRMEQRTETIDFESIDLSALVLTVCRESAELAEKNIVLIEDIRPNLSMRGNAALIARMLANLIQNAYRYGKEGGMLAVGLQATNDTISLSVRDDGMGIRAEDLPRIWNRFYQADASRSGAKSMGLGLAMVQQIAKLHGGNVDVQSEPGQGSTFTVQFPKSGF